MKPAVFAVPVFDRWLVHAPLHRVDALLNPAALDRLRRGDVGGNLALAAVQDELRAAPGFVPRPLAGSVAPDFLGFITTRACNIGCAYCDFGGPTARKVDIDPAVAVAAIDWMADRLVASGRRTFQVHLFGGEPFHAPESVDLIVHRTRAVCARRNLIPWFEVSTNGVFNEARARWVGQYIDGVVLSFDGPPEFHNRNRPGFGGRPTYDVVERTARLLSTAPTELCLRTCVTADSVGHMERIVRWMCAEFRPAVVNFEPLTENDLTRGAGLAPPDPYAYAVNWWAAYRAGRELGVKVVYSAVEADRPRISSCPVGTDTLIISPDGRASACYMLPEDWRRHGMEMDVGWVRPGGVIDIDRPALDRVRHLVTEKPRCERCLAQWACAGGCHVTHSYTGCPTAYDDFCLQTRIVSVCLILDRLGEGDLADALLADRAAMERLATHELDVLDVQPGGPTADPEPEVVGGVA